ncbi:MAG: hypothetical protein K8R59_01435 [Thermoanaerobaculales bacterium]|nr:hypothetical protein [Thermoanaerobaculales bacterium]
MKHHSIISRLVFLVGAAVLTAGSAFGQTPSIADGDDWTLPEWVEPLPGTGFFSEELSPDHHVNIRVVDVSWRQVNPAPGVYSTTRTGEAQGMEFPSLEDQLASDDPFWMRIWASGADWVPEWVVTDCGLTETWPDYDDQEHLPIWYDCLWNHLMTLWRTVFIDWNLRADRRLVMLYAHGAFTWCEFDFEIIEQAAEGGLSFDEFDSWFHPAMVEMVDIFNGDNDDPTDDFAHKLVYTGEDYPWGPWDGSADLLARDAVEAGLGIRTGITEVFNFHLNHIPAYGTTIASDGHMVTDETWPLLSDGRTIASENECYNACGYSTSDPYYAVVMSNLKALQMRVNRLYVVPSDSFMDQYPEHWQWVRLSLGHNPKTSPDAWVALREAKDRYWVDDDSHNWIDKPWVHNLEHFLVQRDIEPDAVSRRGTDVRSGEVDPENGTAYEGRSTDRAAGQNALAFFVDDAFLSQPEGSIELKITYSDTGRAQWMVQYPGTEGVVLTSPVTNTDSGAIRTATFILEHSDFDGSLTGNADLRIVTDLDEVEIRFVRLVKMLPPEPPTARLPRGRRSP